MAKEMYEGQLVETIDCTPTWRWATSVHLALLQQEWRKRNPNQEIIDNATKGIYEMADHLDRINQENKKQ
jgi:hypothetical protein